MFLKKQDVFMLCDKAALLSCSYICVYSGELCDYEIYLSLSVYCSNLTHWGVQISVGKIGERWIVGLSRERVDFVGGIHGGGVESGREVCGVRKSPA